MLSTSAPALHVDGRRARGLRAHGAIVDAMLGLIQDGDLRPTAARVAARAGVSLRSVFQHFPDLESIFTAAAERRIDQVRRLVVPLPAEGPLDERITAFVAARVQLLEAITPVRRAALLVEPFSPVIASRLERGRRFFKQQVHDVFAHELDGLAAPEQRELVAALTVAVSWSAWEQLRRHQGLPPARARAAVVRVLRGLLATAR